MKIVPILSVVLLAAAGWFRLGENASRRRSERRTADRRRAARRPDEAITATGSITAQTGAEVKIGSQITGRIKKLNADIGKYVHANDIIAELDLPDIAAQYQQAKDNLTSAQTKLQQEITGLPLQISQTSNAVTQARADVDRAQARLQSALAALSLQTTQTPTNISRAKSDVSRAKAALSTSISAQKQVEASVNLQIATAQEQLNQANANQLNYNANLKRQQELLKQGFVAQSVVDAAVAQASVNTSQIASAQQNIGLVQAKVAADRQAASDTVAQAQEALQEAQQALVAAQAGTYTDVSRQADVRDARQQLKQSQAALQAAIANIPQNTIKQQDITQARDAMEAATEQVAYEAAQYDKTFIRSPINGTVLQLAAQQGETLAAGLSSPTLIVVADLKRLQVDVFVDETDIGKVRLGQEADVQLDAFPKRKFVGKIVKIASGSTIQQGVVTYDVTVNIEDPKHRLKPDMTANVTIQTGKKTNVLLVPAESVKVGKRGSIVNILTKVDGKMQPKAMVVKTGATDGVNTEIVSGLNEGDTVIRAGLPAQTGKPGGAASPFGGPGGGGGGRGR